MESDDFMKGNAEAVISGRPAPAVIMFFIPGFDYAGTAQGTHGNTYFGLAEAGYLFNFPGSTRRPVHQTDDRKRLNPGYSQRPEKKSYLIPVTVREYRMQVVH
jgi:hypothetical protein